MFSKFDFIKLVADINEVEKKMEITYQHIADNISNPEYKKIFQNLSNDEKNHQSKLETLKELFDSNNY